MRKCRNCSTMFNHNRAWQVFCSADCRNSYNDKARGTCFYCGAPSEHRDHVDPVARTGKKRSFFNDEWIYSCRECNLTLTGHVFDSIEDRMAYILTKYKKTRDDIIEWDASEVHEMGRGLRKSLEDQMLLRAQYDAAIKYLTIHTNYMQRHHAEKKQEINAMPEHRKPKALEIACIRCKRPFIPSGPDDKFCTHFCDWAYNHKETDK